MKKQFLSKFIEAFSSIGAGTSVGLSIGSSSIKLVELLKTGKTWKLLHFGIVQLPEDVIVDRDIVNQIAVSESIKTLLAQISLKTKNVCVGISGASLIIKRMMLEVPNPRDLQDQVFWEAEQYIPFDLSEVVMDFHLISRTKAGKSDVLLVGAKKSFVDNYISCIDSAGLKALVVDVDLFSLANVYEVNYPSNPSQAVALVDVGACATKVVVVQGGVPVFTKECTIGGRTLTNEIQRNLNLSYADAEVLKTGAQGGPMPQEVSDLIQVTAHNLGMEIKKALDFYSASSSGAPVTSMLLTGGSAKIPDLSKVVEDASGVPVQLLNPFNAISYDPAIFTPDYVDSIASIAAVPLGLALRAGAK